MKLTNSSLLRSIALMQRAQQVIPGGVNSPVRAFGQVAATARFIQRGEGAYLYDVDGNKYIDYVCSWGPLILGHNHPAVVAALQAVLSQGTSFGAPTQAEVELAELIVKLLPSVEMIRMVNSGTEATMSAIRLARGFTRRNKIIKFTDCYHGHSDSLLVQAGSGVLTLSLAGSAGVPQDFVAHTLTAPYNDLAATAALFNHHGDDIAAVIVEPIAANMNLILPEPNFLPGLRELCNRNNSVLIFDEVITGFRVAIGGAQQLYNVKPDLTCFGKIIGGGLPVGAFGGRAEIMQQLAPLGPVYQAGTLSGNPLAMAAGLATIKQLQSMVTAGKAMECTGTMPITETAADPYQILADLATQLTTGLQELANMHGIALRTNMVGGLFGIHFVDDPGQRQFKQFFAGMLRAGVYLAPSAYEAGFISLAHNTEIIAQTLRCADQVFSELITSELQGAEL